MEHSDAGAVKAIVAKCWLQNLQMYFITERLLFVAAINLFGSSQPGQTGMSEVLLRIQLADQIETGWANDGAVQHFDCLRIKTTGVAVEGRDDENCAFARWQDQMSCYLLNLDHYSSSYG